MEENKALQINSTLEKVLSKGSAVFTPYCTVDGSFRGTRSKFRPVKWQSFNLPFLIQQFDGTVTNIPAILHKMDQTHPVFPVFFYQKL